MEAIGPTFMDSEPELEPYNIGDYQSTHNTGAASWAPTRATR